MEWCDPKLIKLSDKNSTSEKKASGIGCGNGNSEAGNCTSGGLASSYCIAGGNYF